MNHHRIVRLNVEGHCISVVEHVSTEWRNVGASKRGTRFGVSVVNLMIYEGGK